MGKTSFTTGNLNSIPSMRQSTIDFDKVQTIEDIKNILRGLQIFIFDNGGEQFATLRPYLKSE